MPKISSETGRSKIEAAMSKLFVAISGGIALEGASHGQELHAPGKQGFDCFLAGDRGAAQQQQEKLSDAAILQQLRSFAQ